VFWDNKAGGTFFATAGVTWEERTGGTMPGAAPAAIGDTYVEALGTRRFDAGAVAQTVVAGKYVAVARGSFVSQRLEHRFGELTERDTHQTTFGELTLRGTAPHQTWVVGGALERDTFDPIDVPRFAFAYTVPGVFAQDEVDLATWLSISASARVDAHSEYGTFLSPRVSVLFKGDDWSSRVSFGSGFFAPTPLIEETEAAGLSRLTLPRRLTAERGESASVDFSGAAGGLRATVTVFASRVREPLDVQRDAVFALVNRSTPTTNAGLDFVSSWRGGPFSVVAAYAYVRAREGDADVPLTPRHTAGIDWAWERPSTWRLGVECYYTGAQRLEANPYRDESRPYTVFGVLVLRKLGRYRLFVNGENLSDVRQTRWDPLLRPAQGVDGRWTVDAWAPLDGRNINGGVRIGF
jgi:iron complex outermembrane receptor protein